MMASSVSPYHPSGAPRLQRRSPTSSAALQIRAATPCRKLRQNRAERLGRFCTQCASLRSRRAKLTDVLSPAPGPRPIADVDKATGRSPAVASLPLSRENGVSLSGRCTAAAAGREEGVAGRGTVSRTWCAGTRPWRAPSRQSSQSTVTRRSSTSESPAWEGETDGDDTELAAAAARGRSASLKGHLSMEASTTIMAGGRQEAAKSYIAKGEDNCLA